MEEQEGFFKQTIFPWLLIAAIFGIPLWPRMATLVGRDVSQPEHWRQSDVYSQNKKGRPRKGALMATSARS